MKETQMIYKFDYLPAGLFNRGQVGLLFRRILLDSVTVQKTC